jgi:hypothetical protein
MEFDTGEREYLDWMRMLSTDNAGNEIFVGLTVDESREYYAYTRPYHQFNGDSDAQERYLKLNEKMQRARFAVMGAEIVARDDKSPRH